MRGIYLQGGGAKGAFQAGVIYGLYEKGLDFNILSGTSIGAINSYFLLTGNIEKLKEVWNDVAKYQKHINKSNVQDLRVIDNDNFISIIKELQGRDKNIKSVYVNYVEVKGSILKEKIVDIASMNNEKSIEAVKYSALLPCRPEDYEKVGDLLVKFDSYKLFDNFKEDLDKGIYDGYRLDGGILNNNLLNPFVENRVTDLYIVTFSKNYQIPEYISKYYRKDQIKLIKPNSDFKPQDTLRFETKFCREIFKEGYNISKYVK